MTTKPKTKSPAPAAELSAKPQSKTSTVLALITRTQGATLEELTDATSWQPHSARAALTGLRKKGHAIEKAKRGELTCYHIAGQA